MAKAKVAKKVVQKKVVKKRVAKKAPERVENIDLVTYFKTGKKEPLDDWAFVEGNVMYCQTNHPKVGDYLEVGVKVDGYIVINGDDVKDLVGDFGEVVENLQDYGDNEITTSFECLKNAGIDLQKIRILGIYKDLDKSSNKGDKDFDDFESNVPQGATYKESATYCYGNDVSQDDEESQKLITEIVHKRYHRAGCMLIKEGKFTYICGMDENSYFVTKLLGNPKTIEAAFQSLKPKYVQAWEKLNNTVAKRQGEWFFIPTNLTKVKGMRRKGLPLLKKGGNKHMAEYYAIMNTENYVKGDINHVDHETTTLGEVIHEAVVNTAVGSWSVQGVD